MNLLVCLSDSLLIPVLIRLHTVLQAIRLRYSQKEIYTYSGIVLIATNPFARVDSLYVPGMVQVYAGKQRATQAPHLFAIAEEAFAYAAHVDLQTSC